MSREKYRYSNGIFRYIPKATFLIRPSDPKNKLTLLFSIGYKSFSDFARPAFPLLGPLISAPSALLLPGSGILFLLFPCNILDDAIESGSDYTFLTARRVLLRHRVGP
jgi:hypothetical protein